MKPPQSTHPHSPALAQATALHAVLLRAAMIRDPTTILTEQRRAQYERQLHDTYGQKMELGRRLRRTKRRLLLEYAVEQEGRNTLRSEGDRVTPIPHWEDSQSSLHKITEDDDESLVEDL